MWLIHVDTIGRLLLLRVTMIHSLFLGQCSWKIPSQMVRVKDPLVLEVVTPDLLKDTLNLYYLHRDVAAMLNSTLTSSLGIESLNTEHLLQVGKSLSQKWSADKERAEKGNS